MKPSSQPIVPANVDKAAVAKAAADAKARQAKLKDAMEWKIIEIESLMSSVNATLATLDEARLWIRPREYDQVVEERVSMDRCGYPSCKNSLKPAKSTSNSPTFRADFKTGKVYEVQMSKDYCGGACLEASVLYKNSLEVTDPLTRKVVKSLDVSICDKSAEELLALMKKDKEIEAPQSIISPAIIAGDVHDEISNKREAGGADSASCSPSAYISTGSAAPLAPFISAGKFSGAQPGYYFSTGRAGLGYYSDSQKNNNSIGSSNSNKNNSNISSSNSNSSSSSPKPAFDKKKIVQMTVVEREPHQVGNPNRIEGTGLETSAALSQSAERQTSKYNLIAQQQQLSMGMGQAVLGNHPLFCSEVGGSSRIKAEIDSRNPRLNGGNIGNSGNSSNIPPVSVAASATNQSASDILNLLKEKYNVGSNYYLPQSRETVFLSSQRFHSSSQKEKVSGNGDESEEEAGSIRNFQSLGISGPKQPSLEDQD